MKPITTLRSRIAAFSPTILLPLLIVSVAFGVLAFQSYRLAARMEVGLKSFAIEYLHSSAEIAARRVDAEVSRMLAQAVEDWQQIEREQEDPNYSDLELWLQDHPWMTYAIYVPDADPLGTVYVSSDSNVPEEQLKTVEFYTSQGAMRYSYDPAVLLALVRGDLLNLVDDHTRGFSETDELRRRSRVELIKLGRQSPAQLAPPQESSVVVSLTAPVSDYAIRASIDDAFIGAGWHNHRVVSIWLSIFALVMLFIAGALVWRGIVKERDTLALRAALIANVSHELRTPLSMIRLGVETLKRGGANLQESQRHDIQDSIHRESIHLSHLVENVLDVARMEQGSAKLVPVPIDPADMVNSLVGDYRAWLENKGFEVDLDLDQNLGEQMWDREMLSRALLNLIDNAVKYSEDQKELAIIVRGKPETIAISVRDRGVGLKAGDIDKIFEPYYRARFSDTATQRGAGLGLTLVREIVRAHGGRMNVVSRPGEGSTFTMLLPRTV